jgi:hypothetical protein
MASVAEWLGGLEVEARAEGACLGVADTEVDTPDSEAAAKVPGIDPRHGWRGDQSQQERRRQESPESRSFLHFRHLLLPMNNHDSCQRERGL